MVTIATQPVYGLPKGQSSPDTYAQTVIRSKPIVFWRLGEAAGATVAVDEMGSYNGTYNGATLAQAPLHHTQSKSITITSTNNMTSPTIGALSVWSIALWAKSTTSYTFTFHFTLPASALLIRLGSGDSVIRESEGSGWTSSSTSWAVNEKIHLAAVYNGSSTHVYKNGIDVYTASRINRASTSGAWYINSDASGGCALQDFSGWDRVLTANEIKALYLTGV